MTDPLFTFEPEKHVYKYDGKKMTGCTTILGILNKPALVGWAAKEAAYFFYENIVALCLETGGGFNIKLKEHEERLDKILEEARIAHAKKRDDGAQKGTDTHALVEDYVNDCIENYNGKPYRRTSPGSVARETDPLSDFVKWAMRERIVFLASEKQFYSKSLWVAGTADLIFEKDGKRYIGDIKTYKKIWDRTPFYQCAGYALMAEEMGEEKFDGYCIINLPKERKFNVNEDIKWSFDIKGDTEAFLACVTLYRQNANF